MDTLAFVSEVALSIAVGLLSTFGVCRLARRRGWVMFPASHHIHKRGIPRLGGIAVFGTFVFIFFVGAATGVDPTWREQLPILLPASAMFLVGLVDDARGLRARTKLACQIAAGVWLFFAQGSVFHFYPLATQIQPAGLGLAISLLGTVAWVVMVTNAFNLIDGLDGLAAGATLFSLVTLCVLAMADHNMGSVFTTLILGGAVLGFLRFNFNPASIFLGDSGSYFLGFMLSGLSLQPRAVAAPNLVAVAIPLLAFGLPILETGVSVVRRFLGDKPLFAPDRDHIHHRLLRMGFSQRQAVAVLYGACALCSLLSLFLLYPDRPLVGLTLIAIIVGVLSVLGIQSLGYQEFCEISRLSHRWFGQKKVIANNIAVRKAIEALKACNAWSEVSIVLDSLLKIGEFDSYSLTVLNECAIRRTLREGKVADRTLMDELSEEGIGMRRAAAWSFAVDLPVRGQDPIGNFMIGRVHGPDGLRMDINILLSEVQPVLGAVCDRIHRKEVHRRRLESVSGGLQKSVDLHSAHPSGGLPKLVRSRELGREESGLAS